MYYTNWGRYTQLAGQVILPVAIWLVWQVLEPGSLITSNGSKDLTSFPKKGLSWKMLAMASLALAGLALTYFRIIIFAMIFLLAFWIILVNRKSFRILLIKTLWIGLGSGLLFLPWFIRIFSGQILHIFAGQISTSAAQALNTDSSLMSAIDLSAYLPTFVWIMLIVCMSVGLWRREKAALVVIIWWLGNYIAANPWIIGLPGSGAINGFTYLIAVYVPASVLIGAGFSWLVGIPLAEHHPNPKIAKIFSAILVIFFLGLSTWGLPKRLAEVQPPNFSLTGRPDIRAAAWLEHNTPADARILINSFPAFNNSLIVGSDGGWWLPMLAHRLTTVPPINYGFEKDPVPSYRLEVNALTFEIQAKTLQDISVISLLRDRNISYVYIGQRQGLLNSPAPLFTTEQLLSNPSFELVYHQDRVWIFRLKGSL